MPADSAVRYLLCCSHVAIGAVAAATAAFIVHIGLFIEHKSIYVYSPSFPSRQMRSDTPRQKIWTGKTNELINATPMGNQPEPLQGCLPGCTVLRRFNQQAK